MTPTKHARYEDLLHVAIVLVLLFLVSACASNRVADTPAPNSQPLTVTPAVEAPSAPVATPAADLTPEPACQPDAFDTAFAAKDREKSARAMYEEFKNYIVDQCMFRGCMFPLPTFDHLNTRINLLGDN